MLSASAKGHIRNMNKTTLTIGGIFLTALGTIVYASADYISQSPKILFWIGYVLVAVVVSILGSWGLTEYFKKTRYAAFIVESINKGFNPKNADDRDPYEQERRKTYRVATWSCFGLMVLAGYIFRLLESGSKDIDLEKYIQVVAILWLLLSLVVAFLSAPLWRISYDKIRPRLFRAGKKKSETPSE